MEYSKEDSEGSYEREFQNEYNSENYCPLNIVKSNAMDYNPQQNLRQQSDLEELKHTIEDQFEEKVSRGNTLDSKHIWVSDKENDINQKNVTFAKTDSNLSTIKSNVSDRQSKKLNKLEKLYNELSMLENSMD